MRDEDTLYLYDEKGMGTGYLSGAEYLRYGIGQSDLSFHGPVEGQGVQVFGYEKDGLNVRMSIRNESSGESYVEVPLQHYKGYTAVVSATGEGLELEDGFHFDIRIRVPKGFEGEVSVGFVPPWYWHLGNGISLLALAAVSVGIFYEKGFIKKYVTKTQKGCLIKQEVKIDESENQ